MKIDVLLGLQWGDEGKGKIVDVLAPKYKAIVRFQGGPNAGHTIEIGNDKFVLHTIPSGIFHKGIINIVGNGVVVDPLIFVEEIKKLKNHLPQCEQDLYLSSKAHIILPTHRLMDAAQEAAKGSLKIGSTLKGIGPAYTDKVGRLGLRIGDILTPNFMERYNKLKEWHLKNIAFLGFDVSKHLIDGLIFEEYEAAWLKAIEIIKGMNIIQSEYFVNKIIQNGDYVLAEGAQGSMLDIDFGTYPFVTSSNTISAGVGTGLGVAPNKVGEIYGIFKAYCTRVGSGPFPTELLDAQGEELRKQGHEYGSTTGRPRRCGWLDLVALKYSVMLSGVTKLIMTKADVLDQLETINVCTHYQYNGITSTQIPYDINQSVITPVYESIKGWNKPIGNILHEKDFPKELQNYIRYLEEQLNIPIYIVSVGPNRNQTIIRSV